MPSAAATSSRAREESGVLKLVHPGGIVEVHRRPVAASYVMARNPRHFVTRPDVFRFPWFVVRPDSLLRPGRVFFIVPCHTLYRLLRSSKSPPPRLLPPTPPPSATEKADPAPHGNCKLKSCLKKGNSARSLDGRRVQFVLPETEDED
ncbi:uncharacterized protein LOC109726803 [Ananas comosus]|uniref:Uncharacterized protein LOC109726803 n=1 Tax=Ananas comosus TaxID=4615 RepID=A0A6P5GU29_ANACO|nr:uncharacterized protein LOC109726803 [Ananas comosus]